MGQSIPIEISTMASIEIDATVVADGLGLAVQEFRRLMQSGKISVLCERGTGDDLGRFRATFYHGASRVSLVVDRGGKIFD